MTQSLAFGSTFDCLKDCLSMMLRQSEFVVGVERMTVGCSVGLVVG